MFDIYQCFEMLAKNKSQNDSLKMYHWCVELKFG